MSPAWAQNQFSSDLKAQLDLLNNCTVCVCLNAVVFLTNEDEDLVVRIPEQHGHRQRLKNSTDIDCGMGVARHSAKQSWLRLGTKSQFQKWSQYKAGIFNCFSGLFFFFFLGCSKLSATKNENISCR